LGELKPATFTAKPLKRTEAMLISPRKTGDTFRIPDVIEVTVLEVKDNQVRVGITTPKEIPAYREVIYQRVVHEQITQL